jgi:polysaccharide pyruvyl transferase WcaK-like protein
VTGLARPPLRIALLTPYSGTNLGDAAIQESVIQHLRRRVPGVLISGITLNPRLTSQRHGIPCFPIAGVAVRYYFSPGAASPAAAAAPVADAASTALPDGEAPRTFRQAIKRLPGIGPALRSTVGAARHVWGVRRELTHLARAWAFAKDQDLIVAAGGGQIDDEWGGSWGHPYALFKWALLARLTGARFVVLSVGVGFLDRRLSRWFIRRALRLAAYRSYRDEGSRDLLCFLEFTRGDACVPDLAFGLDLPPRAASRPREGPPRVGVSPIAYGDPERWPTERRGVFERYLRELEAFVAWLLSRGYEVVLFASSGSDRPVAAALLQAVTAAAPHGTEALRIRRASDDTLSDLLAELDRVDLVVASRLHGVVLAHLLGKPVVAVSFDRKVATHMASMGQQPYCLDIHEVGSDALQETFGRLEHTATAERARLEGTVAECRRAVEAQYDTVVRLALREESGA